MKTIPLRIICTWKYVQFLEILDGNRPQVLGSLQITLQWDRLYLRSVSKASSKSLAVCPQTGGLDPSAASVNEWSVSSPVRTLFSECCHKKQGFRPLLRLE